LVGYAISLALVSSTKGRSRSVRLARRTGFWLAAAVCSSSSLFPLRAEGDPFGPSNDGPEPELDGFDEELRPFAPDEAGGSGS